MESTFKLRAAAALTADEILTAVRIGPMNPAAGPLYLHIQVGAFTGANDTIDVELEFLNASDVEQANLNMKQITETGFYHVPFWTDQPTLQVKLNITDNTTTVAMFAGVEVWVSTSPVS